MHSNIEKRFLRLLYACLHRVLRQAQYKRAMVFTSSESRVLGTNRGVLGRISLKLRHGKLFTISALGRIRTCDPLVRSQVL